MKLCLIKEQKYKAMGLKSELVSEQDYRQYILDEYTFLKRPVFIINNKIFVGNSKKEVERLKRPRLILVEISI